VETPGVTSLMLIADILDVTRKRELA